MESDLSHYVVSVVQGVTQENEENKAQITSNSEKSKQDLGRAGLTAQMNPHANESPVQWY